MNRLPKRYVSNLCVLSMNSFLDSTQDCFLNQLVAESTRGQNMLDLVLAHNQIPIAKMMVDCPMGLSHHSKVVLSSVVPQTKNAWKTRCLDFRRGNYKKFRRYLAETSWNDMQTFTTVEDIWSFF